MRYLHRRRACVAALLAVAAAGCSDLGAPIRPRPQAVLSSSTLDFGTVAVSDSASRAVVVANTGTGVLVGEAAVECAEYVLRSGGGPFSIPPGGTHTIEVSFRPGGTGSFACTLDLGPDCPAVPVTGTGALQMPGALALVLPDSLDFGVLDRGDVARRTFQVFNVGTAPLALDVAAACGSFNVLAGSGPRSIAPGASVSVTVEFAPQTGGLFGCSISVGPGIAELSARGFATTVSFADDVQSIFASYCDGCHSFSDPVTGYDQMTVLPIPYPPGVRVKPFDLVGSVLYGKITNSGQYGQLMPQGGPLIPLADRNTIRDWIMEGARDN